MAQTVQLVSILKQFLKSHGLSYRDVATELDLSEASVKRMFSECRLSLQRLDAICQMMGVEISDLVVVLNQQTMASSIAQLSIEQEQELAADPLLILVTVCVLNGWSMDDLMANYHLTETQCIHYFAVLDRLAIIELLPKNRFKLRVAVNFRWQPNGPIQRFFQQKLAADFFNSKFEQADEQLTVMNGMLSASGMQALQRKLRQLAIEFEELNQDERGLPTTERQGMTLVLAARPWQYGLFDGLRKH